MSSAIYLFNMATAGVTKGLWANISNIEKILLALILIVMIQSGDSFVHAMTAVLSWHVQNWQLMGLFFM